ncbi:hypothetical protein HO173_002715 [Letharia columbiana]|uniref:Uncharacterized protein n=1 Tax=Letharia columbiana TaxID=112416 RepID=A0A8H6L8H8_9LECA|nr:uncharacterized protein HO173_002715 [Letharia columbiana]KAF6239453.1 hypothetical protein HO173_002715 [Letharia columbiana]
MATHMNAGQASQEPHTRRTNLVTNARSPPTSQASSGSLSCHKSQLRPNAAGDLDIISPHNAMTRSTSLSNKSSQEDTDRLYLVEPDVSSVDQDENIDGLVTENALDKVHPSAPKRMANGEVKPSESSLPASPVESSQYGHSRNSSGTSRNSQIGELSNQLRTRLSYAMVKVQNGWQSHNISELESMTSNQASPVSTVSNAHRLYDRHLPAYFPADAPTSIQLSERAAATPDYAHPSPRDSATTAEHISKHRQHGTFDSTSRPSKVGAAYESFWRDHEASGASRPVEAPTVGPSLAPSANIVVRTPRRSDAKKKQPPPLRTDNLGTNSAPITPPPKGQSKIRTPSQQAEVEKDAVETLLFMSSPGNSGYHPPGAFARTPLRNHFERQADQTDSLGFSMPDSARGPREQPRLSYSPHLRSPPRKRRLSNAEMDKILDEMPDTSSSDDGELQGTRPPPQTVGA